MYTANVMNIEEKDEFGYVRLNIILPQDTLAKLDKFKDNAGLASRGRTIQALVDTVWDIQFDTRAMMEKVDQSKTDTDLFHKILPNLVNIFRRITMFEIR